MRSLTGPCDGQGLVVSAAPTCRGRVHGGKRASAVELVVVVSSRVLLVVGVVRKKESSARRASYNQGRVQTWCDDSCRPVAMDPWTTHCAHCAVNRVLWRSFSRVREMKQTKKGACLPEWSDNGDVRTRRDNGGCAVVACHLTEPLAPGGFVLATTTILPL